LCSTRTAASCCSWCRAPTGWYVHRAAQAAGVASVEKANATLTKAATGFSIGGVPPFGHASHLPVIVDEDLLRFEQVWAAGGRPDTVFPIDPGKLVGATGGLVATLRAD
jgi:prolyl-tRNA editing enzyme YbaK/EbsC (Cys-tRNA(Pro) deacylase)